MTDLTSRQMLDAIDKAVKEISRRFVDDAAKARAEPRTRAPATRSNGGSRRERASKVETRKAAL
jgi:hypothetical protein